jgi:glycerate kinase
MLKGCLTVISQTILVAAEPFEDGPDATRIAAAIGSGLQAGNPSLTVDLCPIDGLPPDIDVRLRRARAVVLAAWHLDHETLLRGGAISEIATRARQSGVPCYAVAGHDALDLFEARILDLQVVLEALDTRSLRAAGRGLAERV